jgi:hypothetical protein
VRGFAFVELSPHPAPVFFIIEGVQDVNRLVNTPDFSQCFVDAVLSRVRAEPMQHQRR